MLCGINKDKENIMRNISKIFEFLSIALFVVSCDRSTKIQLGTFQIKEGTNNLSETLTNYLTIDKKGKKQAERGQYYNYTPKDLSKVCSLYGIERSIDILEYKDTIYTDFLIFALPNFNQIAYFKTGEKEMLYYCTISGSTWINARVGAFDFKTKKDMMVDFDFNKTNLMTDFYLAFETSNVDCNEPKLQVYQIEIDKEENKCVKSQLLFDDILQYNLTSWPNS